MYHRIPKLLGTNVHHDEVMMAEVKINFAKKETVLFGLYLKCQGQNEYCKIGLFLVRPASMHHRMPKILGKHVHYDEVVCRTLKTGLYLKGQGQLRRQRSK